MEGRRKNVVYSNTDEVEDYVLVFEKFPSVPINRYNHKDPTVRVTEGVSPMTYQYNLNGYVCGS